MRSKRFAWAWRLLPAWLVVAALAGLAQAQGTLSDVRSEATYQFGQQIRFRLSATSQVPIEAATLFFAAPTLPNTITKEITLAPARELSLEQQVDLSQIRLTPFAPVTYWWQVRDTAGISYAVPEQTVVYADNRFTWQAIGRDGLRAHVAEGGPALGQAALDVVAEVLPRMQAIVPASAPPSADNPLDIYLYPTSSDLQEALRLTGYDWVGGHASPALGLILVAVPPSTTAGVTLRRVIPHELSHLLLFRASGGSASQVPRWFDEGLATFFELDPNPGYEAILQQAVSAGQPLPFGELCRAFPADEAAALLAYAQSGSLIATMQQKYGSHVLTEMIEAFADGAGCEAAVQRVLGLSLPALQAEWWNSLQPQPVYVRALRENGFLLLLALAGFLLVGLTVWLPLRAAGQEK